MSHDLTTLVLIASALAALVFSATIPILVLGRNYDLFN